MNKIKRWYYELTEKQAKTIDLISAIISYILFAILAVSLLISVEASNSDMTLLIIIIFLFLMWSVISLFTF